MNRSSIENSKASKKSNKNKKKNNNRSKKKKVNETYEEESKLNSIYNREEEEIINKAENSVEITRENSIQINIFQKSEKIAVYFSSLNEVSENLRRKLEEIGTISKNEIPLIELQTYKQLSLKNLISKDIYNEKLDEFLKNNR